MPLCSNCTNLPLLSPPPLSPSYNGYGLHSKLLKHLTTLSRKVRIPAEQTATQNAAPLGAAYHTSLLSLSSAAGSCAVCKIVAQQAKDFDAEWEATKESSELGCVGRGYGGPDWEMSVVTGINDTGGFMVVCRDRERRGAVWVVAAVGFGVDDNDALHDMVRGRVVKERPEDSLERTVEWVRQCDTEHVGKRCHVQDTELPARILDLGGDAEGTISLMRTSSLRGKYAALSFVWGDEDSYAKIEPDLETGELGVVVQTLPKTFQDAIRVTKELGLRYLWIDKLCMPQNGTQGSQRSSTLVTAVFANASIVLSATGSSSDDDGMLTPRLSSPREAFEFEAGGKKGTIHVFPTTRESAARRDNHTLLRNEPLSQDVWSLQESYPAPRILHFGSQQMYFECHGHFLSEDGFRMIGRTNTLHYESHPDWLRRDRPDAKSDEDLWSEVLYSYSRRKLAQPSDKLPALSGLARTMAQKTGDQYIAGLWRSRLTNDLIWQAIGTTTAVPEYRAPSWSWAAIDGPFGMFTDSTGPNAEAEKWTNVATIHDIRIDLKTDNLYGEITDAVLEIKAPLEPLFPVDEKSPGSGNVPKQKGAQMRTQNGPEGENVRCIFDTPTHAEQAARGPLWVVLIASHLGGCVETTTYYHGVIVKRVDGNAMSYQRVGKLVCSELSLGKCEWMDDESKKTTMMLV